MKYEDDLKTINQDIKEIYLILIELESLETGENADYTDISTDIGYCKMLLKDRLISLKRKAETEGAIRWAKKRLQPKHYVANAKTTNT